MLGIYCTGKVLFGTKINEKIVFKNMGKGSNVLSGIDRSLLLSDIISNLWKHFQVQPCFYQANGNIVGFGYSVAAKIPW